MSAARQMAMSQQSFDTSEPTIGIVTALPIEYAAVTAVLSATGERVTVAGKGAGREYWTTSVPSTRSGNHTVVVALAEMGNNAAAIRASQMLEHFPSVESIIMTGIAAGIPHPDKVEDHVRLGDIVVSNKKGVIQYDFDKETQDGKEVRCSPVPPSAGLLEAARLLEAEREAHRYPWEKFIKIGQRQLKIKRPPKTTDILTKSGDAKATVVHPKDPERHGAQPRLFFGPIASANKLLKNPQTREFLRDRYGVKAIEMEGSGIADAAWTHGRGYLVVRGICDYADSLKGDRWQRYAALTAAAFTRCLIEHMRAASPAPESTFPESSTKKMLPLVFRQLIEEKTAEFVGRAHVFDAIAAFMARELSGYFTIVADPGEGKTAIAAEYVRRLKCIAHFNIRSEGITSCEQFADSVASQLLATYGVLAQDKAQKPESITGGRSLSALLQEAARGLQSDDRIVIVVDALDEVDDTDISPAVNILRLPATLPNRVYFILARRRTLSAKLFTRAPQTVFDLHTFQDQNRNDIATYLRRASMRPPLKAWRKTHQTSTEGFVAALTEKSQCNFMYLYYVLPEIARGAYTDITVDMLPVGLEGYYEDHWNRMGMHDRPLARDKIKVVYVLAEVRYPVSRDLICGFTQLDAVSVQEVLDAWHQFLRVQKQHGHTRYSLYHNSFREFLYRKDIVRAAGVTIEHIHKEIADYLSDDHFRNEDRSP